LRIQIGNKTQPALTPTKYNYPKYETSDYYPLTKAEVFSHYKRTRQFTKKNKNKKNKRTRHVQGEK